MITLTNKTRRIIVINLAHDIVCEGHGECLCSKALHRSLELNPKTGETGVRETERQLCASLHLLSGETSGPLPESVQQLPEVQQALVGPVPSLKVCAFSEAHEAA